MSKLGKEDGKACELRLESEGEGGEPKVLVLGEVLCLFSQDV